MATKGNLYTRIARTTGTTVGEARGILRNVRAAVDAGQFSRARTILTKALEGGPAAGVKRTPQRVEKAQAASKKIVTRIASKSGGGSKRK